MYQILRGFLRMMSTSRRPCPISASQVHFTSAAVNGLPSCHFTPWRSLKVSLVLSAFHDQLSARSGTIVSGLLTFSLGSNTTRLLNTAMNGWFDRDRRLLVDRGAGRVVAMGDLQRAALLLGKAGAAAITKAAKVPAANANA